MTALKSQLLLRSPLKQAHSAIDCCEQFSIELKQTVAGALNFLFRDLRQFLILEQKDDDTTNFGFAFFGINESRAHDVVGPGVIPQLGRDHAQSVLSGSKLVAMVNLKSVLVDHE